MKRALGRIATLPFLLAAAQPAFAAEDMRDIAGPRHQAAAFAGAKVRIELGGRVRARPTARLQLGVTHIDRAIGSAARTQSHSVGAIELGASRAGEPRLYIGGQEVRQIEQRLGASPSTGTVLLIVGGVLVAGVVIGLMSSGGQLSPCTGGPGC